MKLIDMHCDTLWLMNKRRSEKLRRNQLCIDIEKLQSANSMAQFFACFVNLKNFHSAADAYQEVCNMVAYGKTEFDQCKDSIVLAHRYDEMISNQNHGQISAIFTVEEGGIIDHDLKKLEELYCMGIRLVTLTWNHENCIGFPNSRNPELMKLGLKPFGIEVVRRMNDLGMIVDVSHLSDAGFWDVIQYSRKPIAASHSNARTLCDHPRNLTDEMIKALSEQGGVCGVNFYPYFLNETGKATVEDIVNHVEHLYKIGGEDVIAVGTDFDGFDDGVLDIEHIGEMDKFYDAIRKRGFTERQMDKILNQNILRVLQAQI